MTQQPGSRRPFWVSLSLGATLSVVFFYPLVSELIDSPFYMQWQPLDGLELAASCGSGALLLGGAIHWADRLRGPLARVVATALFVGLPLAPAAAHLLRQLGLASSMGAIARTPAGLALGLAVAALLALSMFLAYREPLATLVVVRAAVLALSPLAVLSAFQVASRSLEAVPLEIATMPGENGGGDVDFADLFVLVFDELDHSFVYDDHREVRAELPSFRRFAATSDNHHQATSPGKRTLSSMPGLVTGVRGMGVDASLGVYGVVRGKELLARDVGRENLFARARARGYHTAIQGWGLPYCQMLAPSLHACRSFSSYNHSTASRDFSPFDPVMTMFVLLPSQPPLGLLKSFAGSRHQRDMVEGTLEAAMSTLDRPGALFQLTHFSIPHVPFAFDTDHYAPAANPYRDDRESYRRQLRYVDHVLGEYLAALEARGRFESSAIIVLSDHAYRAFRPPETHQEIPLLVKAPNQSVRRDIDLPTQSERVLAELLETLAPALR